MFNWLEVCQAMRVLSKWEIEKAIVDVTLTGAPRAHVRREILREIEPTDAWAWIHTGDDVLPWEARAIVDGITFYSLFSDADARSYMREGHLAPLE